MPPPPLFFGCWLLPHLLSLLQYSQSVIWALLNGSSYLFAFGAKRGFLCICRVFRCGWVCAEGVWVLRNFARVLERDLVREVAICAFEVSMRNVLNDEGGAEIRIVQPRWSRSCYECERYWIICSSCSGHEMRDSCFSSLSCRWIEWNLIRKQRCAWYRCRGMFPRNSLGQNVFTIMFG